MARVEIFSTPFCGHCVRAKRLLERKGVELEEIDLSRHPEREAEMIRRSGRLTVPQVFLDGRHLGDCSELLALERDGALDELLAGNRTASAVGRG